VLRQLAATLTARSLCQGSPGQRHHDASAEERRDDQQFIPPQFSF
jgi:hypothetical protein